MQRHTGVATQTIYVVVDGYFSNGTYDIGATLL